MTWAALAQFLLISETLHSHRISNVTNIFPCAHYQGSCLFGKKSISRKKNSTSKKACIHVHLSSSGAVVPLVENVCYLTDGEGRCFISMMVKCYVEFCLTCPQLLVLNWRFPIFKKKRAHTYTR